MILNSLNSIVNGLSKLQRDDAPKPSQKTICADALSIIERFKAGEEDVESIHEFFKVFINKKFYGPDGFLGIGYIGKLANEMTDLFVTDYKSLDSIAIKSKPGI